MGSLMAGWNCPVLDPKTARLERNRSLTREEIASFRRFYKNREDEEDAEEEEEEEERMMSTQGGGGSEGEEAMRRRRRKKSIFWQHLAEKSEITSSAEQGKEKNDITGDWWTRSNWAFLNEPPRDEIDSSSHKYSAQFHVAEMAKKKQHPIALN